MISTAYILTTVPFNILTPTSTKLKIKPTSSIGSTNDDIDLCCTPSIYQYIIYSSRYTSSNNHILLYNYQI